ncbi:hypothetical protein HanIR_Chr08g0358831 [Helianthus annuus]|nr:hypothetical protein HanIR_Chr08g0358831 [Helianthus annuus]
MGAAWHGMRLVYQLNRRFVGVIKSALLSPCVTGYSKWCSFLLSRRSMTRYTLINNTCITEIHA